MRIDRLTRLHNVGVFLHFDWPSTLHSFAQFNLIYGWNGTGKSTLSRLLHCLERKAVPQGIVSINIDGQEVAGSAFPTAGVSIRVFDRDFVERTIRASTQAAIGNPEVPPIFVIGEKNVENQKKADAARAELTAKYDQKLIETSKAGDARAAIDSFCTDQAKLIKDLLTKQGSAYNNYNRQGFRTKADALATKPDANTLVLDDAGLESRIKIHQSTLRDRLSAISYSPPDLKAAYADLTQLYARTITSQVIESLQKDTDIGEWVKAGLALHKERNATSCLYCAQPMPAERLQALNAHFNDAYQSLMDDIAKRVQRVDALQKSVESLSVLKKAEVYDHLASELATESTAFGAYKDAILSALDILRGKYEAKQKAPFEALLTIDEAPLLDSSVIDRVNAIIYKHNEHSDGFAKQIKNAREEIEASKVSAALDKYKSLLKSEKDTAAAVDATINQIKTLEATIAMLDKELREHRKPADELNGELQHYLGHGDLQVSVSDTGYHIKRGGLIATRLSEGEQTAISLLYFLKSLSSKDFKIEEGIVVLDDPVCSLDANALFSAFGYIQERTKKAKQLIVLTHNFMFFRQVRRWYHKLPNQKKKDMSVRPARFYMLRCAIVNGQRVSEICWLDRLLEEYESDYHYTFYLVHQLAKTPIQPLESYFVAPNLARKLMETFLAFHAPGPGGENNFDKLSDIPFDGHKKQRVLRFLNEHSHSSAIGGDQQDFSALNETPAVLSDLLALIESANRAHYDGMISLIVPSSV